MAYFSTLDIMYVNGSVFYCAISCVKRHKTCRVDYSNCASNIRKCLEPVVFQEQARVCGVSSILTCSWIRPAQIFAQSRESLANYKNTLTICDVKKCDKTC